MTSLPQGILSLRLYNLSISNNQLTSLPENIGDSDLTSTLEKAGLAPGRTIIVKKANGKSYDIETEDGTLSLDSDLASKIIVQN